MPNAPAVNAIFGSCVSFNIVNGRGRADEGKPGIAHVNHAGLGKLVFQTAGMGKNYRLFQGIDIIRPLSYCPGPRLVV
ncbi:hypothetical protein FHX06_006555 [Rhizobium sp. BK512]|nr:hypothetical protein [Rhizobium sp. BK512]